MAYDITSMTRGMGFTALTNAMKQTLVSKWGPIYLTRYGAPDDLSVPANMTLSMGGFDNPNRDPWAFYDARNRRGAVQPVVTPAGANRYHVIDTMRSDAVRGNRAGAQRSVSPKARPRMGGPVPAAAGAGTGSPAERKMLMENERKNRAKLEREQKRRSEQREANKPQSVQPHSCVGSCIALSRPLLNQVMDPCIHVSMDP